MFLAIRLFVKIFDYFPIAAEKFGLSFMLHLHTGLSDYQHCCVYRILGFRVQRLSINAETEATRFSLSLHPLYLVIVFFVLCQLPPPIVFWDKVK